MILIKIKNIQYFLKTNHKSINKTKINRNGLQK